ncbi:MAG: single-stranded-DNA-specific exonuclease RecJ [Butyrivibrio sp.]|nr:single-stranded-DNA-specific exonuclease RecJ [Butyrivibrio sp.]
MSKWMIANKKADFGRLSSKFGIRDITARLIANRLITKRENEALECSDEAVEAYLNGGMDALHDPKLMADMEKGAGVMLDRIKSEAKIRVIGDYDVDGICSSYILVSGLRLLGADVDCVLPDRVKDGYGLSIKLVDDAIEAGVDTIITCDNGIAAYDQVKHAKEKGMTVVVTDHHEVPFEIADDGEKSEVLPPADAVIDPKRRDGDYPFSEICGAVVAYKFLQVLTKVAESDEAFDISSYNFSEDIESLDEFFSEMLIFAGIATVCDVMELKDENRVIVKKSLSLIESTRNKGLRAIIHVNSLDESRISCYHYGFVIGPCLNATGRLDLATRALSLFFCEDENEAARIAGDLKGLNDSRKDMTKLGVDAAISYVEGMCRESGLPKVLVIYLPEVHESIAGIIAGKVKEKYYRPTFVLTKASDGGAKGSGRSIEKYDMYEELSSCKELFTKYGGHKMAAGLSLPEENIEILRRKLNENCTLEGNDFEPVLHIDMVMPLKYADMELVREFEKLEPFGNGNSKPVFAQRDVVLLSGRIMGKNRNCGKYRISDEQGKMYEMVYFGDIDKWHQALADRYGQKAVDDLYDYNKDGEMKVNIAYYPDINSFQGRESLQIVMNDFLMPT